MKWLYTMVVFAVLTGIVGCQSIGNGKLDIPEINIGYVGEDGTPYTLAYDKETGLVVEGKYTSPKTGLVYEITQEGGFVVTDPRTGLNIRLKEADGQD